MIYLLLMELDLLICWPQPANLLGPFVYYDLSRILFSLFCPVYMIECSCLIKTGPH